MTACCVRTLSSQTCGRVLSKTKSDASTSTTPEEVQQQNQKTTAGGDPSVITTAEVETNSGITNIGYQKTDDEESDVSATIIDGKRAISLNNFGKFAAQQQLKQNKTNAISLRHKTFDFYY